MNAVAASAGGDHESEVALLRADLLRAKQELKQVQDSFDEYTQSSHELEQELEQELSRAEKKNAFLSAKNQQFEFDLQSAREKLESALAQAHKYERELFGLRDELALAVEAKRKLEQEQDDLVTQVRILQATEEDLRHKMERELEEKVFLVSDQEELHREHELAAERFRTEIVDLKSELYALQQKYDAAVDEEMNGIGNKNQMDIDGGGERREEDGDDDVDAYLHRRSTVHERDAESQEVLIESLQKEIEVLSSRAQEETEARERLEAELIQIQDTLAHVGAMEAEMMEMTEEVIAKAQEVRKRDMEIQALQEQTTSLKMELAALTEANSDLSTTCEELRGQIGEKAAELQTLSLALLDAEAKCNELSENEIHLTSCLESEVELVASLRVQVQELVKTIEEETRLRKELEEQILASRSEISQNKKDVQELQNENSALRDQLESAAKKAAELERASAASTASTSSSTSGELAFADSDSHRLLIEIQSLRTKLNSISAENARLRSQEGVSGDLHAPNKKISANLLTINYTGEQLARKYLAERTRNASLLSRLQTVCGNIQVFCRVRPVIYEELQKSWGSRLAVNVINHSDVAVMDIKADRVFSTGERTISGTIDAQALENLESGASWKVFTFDRILGPEETQNDVFREVEPIAQSVVEGFKACIFAYGQTGSGKTYTMEGTESEPGLNYRVVRHIFQSVQLRGSIYNPAEAVESDRVVRNPGAEDDVDMSRDDVDEEAHTPCYQVQVGVLEIYNETLRDLITVDNSKSLEIRHDSESGDIHVSDLTMASVSSPEQTIDVLRKAQMNRITGHTNVHARSSRSHCVVIVQISTASKRYDGSSSNANEAAANDELCGKLYLVDLAGSERVKQSNVSGEMLREAAHINKSLSALADVMEALDKKLPHVPYRNSKLTFLLQDVLNSSCKTVMIVNVGPTYETANESSRSLQLAERVRHIVVGRNSIVKNKKDILSAKKAFSEIQTLKQQLSISARKYKQAQQSLVAMKRDQKNQSEKQSAALQSRIKTSESQKSTYKTQNEALKRLNDELNEQLKQEREARQKEADQREVAQRMLRQLNAKTRVSSSHQESVESLLKDRETEIKKLRHLLTEARQRSTASLIPRLGSPASVGLSKRTNQNDENENPVHVRPAKALSTSGTTSSSTQLLRKRNSSSLGSTRLGTKPRTEASAPTASGEGLTIATGDGSPNGRTRRASSLRATSTDSSVRAWK